MGLTRVLLRTAVRLCGADVAVATIDDALCVYGADSAGAAELLDCVRERRPLPLGRSLIAQVPIPYPKGQESALMLFGIPAAETASSCARALRTIAAEIGNDRGFTAAAARGRIHASFDERLTQLAEGLDARIDAAAILEWTAPGCDPSLRYVNAAFATLFGYGVEAIIGRTPEFLYGPHTDRERLAFLDERVRLAGEARSIVVLYRCDGVPVWVELHLVRGAAGGGDAVVATLRDVSALKEFERAMAREKRKLQVTLAAIGDAVITTVSDGRVDFVNGAAEMIFGLDAAEAYGHPIGEVLRLTNVAGATIDVLRTREPGAVVHRGQALFDRGVGAVTHISYVTSPVAEEGYVVVLRDVTAQHRLATQLSYEASHDALTSMYNRRKFDEVLDDAIDAARRGDGPHALAFLDLDRFKAINDACGHATGDRVLVDLAHLIQQQLRGRDVLARIGGDEFAVLLHDCTLDNARWVLDLLRLAVQAYRVNCQGVDYGVGVSIGVVPVDGSERDPRKLFAAADAACYAAKSSGRNAVAG